MEGDVIQAHGAAHQKAVDGDDFVAGFCSGKVCLQVSVDGVPPAVVDGAAESCKY